MYRKPRIESLAIASGATTSAVVHLRDYMLAGIILPAALTSTAITFTACDTKDGTFVAVYDSDGNAVSVTAAAARAVGLSGAEADALAPFAFIKLVCGTAEGGDRVIKLVLK